MGTITAKIPDKLHDKIRARAATDEETIAATVSRLIELGYFVETENRQEAERAGGEP